MWRKYKVRPSKNDGDKTKCNNKFCIYDNAHDDYLYTLDWINFLTVKELNTPRNLAPNLLN